MRYFLFFNFFFLFAVAHSQTPQQKADSLENAAKIHASDTNGVKALYALADIYKYSDKEKALLYANKCKETATKIKDDKGYNLGMLVTGSIYFIQGNYDTAEVCYNKALAYFRANNLKKETAKCLSNLGNVNNYRGDPGKALPLLLEAAKIDDEINDHLGLCNAYLNLGNTYYQQTKYNEALLYYFKALPLAEKLSKTLMQSQILNNVGAVMRLQNKVDSAIIYYRQSLALRTNDPNIEALAESNLNLGDAYFHSSKPDSALFYFTKAKGMYMQLGHQKGLTVCYVDLGSYYALKKKNKEALIYLKMADSIAQKIGVKDIRAEAAKQMTEVYKIEGNFKNAFETQTLYMLLKDSMLNEQSQKQLNELQTKFDSEKKDKDLLQQKAELEREHAENKQKSTERNAFIVGFVLMFILAIFIFRGYKQKQKINTVITKQKTEVERQRNLVQTQKELVEEKQKEILDSIHYAKRIQTALLPSEKYITRNLNKK
jgi:tetratricopeptide (TPR) repeat protein